MSIRKKRLIIILAGVLLCAILMWVLGTYVQEQDAREFAKKCKSYEGVWVSEDEKTELTVRRVTGAHMVISLKNKESGAKLSHFAANMTVDNTYEFHYQMKMDWGKYQYVPKYGDKETGSIVLGENQIQLSIPKGENTEGWAFQGVLKKKEKLETEAVSTLTDWLGKTESLEEKLQDYCGLERDESGRIYRLHALWEKEPDEYYDSYIGNINKNCFEGDCVAAFGEPEREGDLENGRRKLVFLDDTYQYTFIFNSYGLVAAGDCQYREVPGFSRHGDFLMKGDTLVRYLGDGDSTGEIILPESTKKIATHAFTYEDNMIPWYAGKISIVIPKDVSLEKEAFARCGKMEISFEEGRTEIEHGAFANMIGENDTGRRVNVVLPESMKKLGEDAFAYCYEDNTERLMKNDTEIPVSVTLNKGLEYIGDNALKGVWIKELPENVVYIGSNITLNASELRLPDRVETLGRRAVNTTFSEFSSVTIPASVKEISEDAFCHRLVQDNIVVDEKNPYFKSDRSSGLLSKDGKVLYRMGKASWGWDFTDIDIGETDKLTRDKVSETTKNEFYEDEDDYLIINIAKGVEQICEEALLSSNSLWFGYRCVLPTTVKRINRNALFLREGPSEIYLRGDTPEFYGEFTVTEDTAVQDIYVKKGTKKEFLKKLYQGQKNIDVKVKKRIEKKLHTW